jgi:hypothetical protein
MPTTPSAVAEEDYLQQKLANNGDIESRHAMNSSSQDFVNRCGL